jgi:hypothetical protein
MPTPLAHTHHEKLDLEVGWRLPLAKHLEDSLLAFSYSMGEPCGRSDQLITYFIFSSVFANSPTDHGEFSLLFRFCG